MRNSLSLLFGILFLASRAMGHGGDDHGAPGALPFAPHGGKAVEAVAAGVHDDHEDENGHEDEHDHGGGESGHKHEEEKGHVEQAEVELFFEATYAQGRLTVFPLTLNEKNPKEFFPLNAESVISEFRVVVEFPRSKQSKSVPMELAHDVKNGSRWTGVVPVSKDIRFFAVIRAVWQGKERSARIHLEKRK